MNKPTVGTSLDIPAALHRRLQEAAARSGSSARLLILRTIERAVEESKSKDAARRLSLTSPLVPRSGRNPFDLTNDQIYELIDLP